MGLEDLLLPVRFRVRPGVSCDLEALENQFRANFDLKCMALF